MLIHGLSSCCIRLSIHMYCIGWIIDLLNTCNLHWITDWLRYWLAVPITCSSIRYQVYTAVLLYTGSVQVKTKLYHHPSRQRNSGYINLNHVLYLQGFYQYLSKGVIRERSTVGKRNYFTRLIPYFTTCKFCNYLACTTVCSIFCTNFR